uniref:molybdopterin synthase sulfur carrier subunit n=1 Tax=Staphylococcus pasteuri TaxID=45972 RepID=UPI0012B74970
NKQSETIHVSHPLTLQPFKVIILEHYPQIPHNQFQIPVNQQFLKLTHNIQPPHTLPLIPPLTPP